MDDAELTEVERDAKRFFDRLLAGAYTTPGESVTASEIELKLPPWYDAAKYKRGQKFFADNRFGIMQANLCSLLVLLVDPKGLNILHHTAKSSTAETARKRYISTVLSMLSWYEHELTPGSKSWQSLMRIRKMHLYASNSAKKRDLGFISQVEMSLTTFGFMGFPLIRPHLLGVRYDNREDRDAFVHFWAVIGSLLGVEDRFNMCLHRLEVVEMVCKIVLRYVFVPSLQLETPLFRQMIGAIVDGLGEFTPFTSYGSLLFQTRRLAGIPGYQYMVDLEKETLCRDLYGQEDMEKLLKTIHPLDGYKQCMSMYRVIFSHQVKLFTVKDVQPVDEINQNTLEVCSLTGKYRALDDKEKWQQDTLHEFLGLRHNEELVVTTLQSDVDWRLYLSDSKLQKLSTRDQGYLKFNCRSLDMSYSKVGKFVNEAILSYLLFKMRRAHEG